MKTIKSLLLLLIVLFVLAGCHSKSEPFVDIPKGGKAVYYYDDGQQPTSGITPLLGPYDKADKEAEEKCNFYQIVIFDENGQRVRFVEYSKTLKQWIVIDYDQMNNKEDERIYDQNQKFINEIIYYRNEKGKVVKHVELLEDGSVGMTEVICYLEDGVTVEHNFVYNENNTLVFWNQYFPPEYNEMVEMDVNEAPEEYKILK